MSQKVSVKKKLLKTICMPGRLGPENRRNFLWRRNFFGGYCIESNATLPEDYVKVIHVLPENK
jgi:hypothetical protein